MRLKIGIDENVISEKHVAVVTGLHLSIDQTFQLEQYVLDNSPTSLYSFCKPALPDKMLFSTISLTERTSS